MNFKSSDELIARVTKQLSSFNSSGLLDQGDFYRWIKEILSLLNIPAYSPIHTIIPLNGDNKIIIPEDMYQLWSVWKYEDGGYTTTPEKHFQYQTRALVTETQCLEKCNDVCHELYEEGDILVTKHFIETSGGYVTRKHYNRTPIKVVNYKINQCNSNSPSLSNRSPYNASMDNHYINFNFSEGSVYLQYYAMMLDDDGLPMIPDVAEIELTIENYIVYRLFQELYINNSIDALQRMQYFEIKYKEAFDKAKTWVKTPSFKSMLEQAQKNKGRYKLFELKHSRA